MAHPHKHLHQTFYRNLTSPIITHSQSQGPRRVQFHISGTNLTPPIILFINHACYHWVHRSASTLNSSRRSQQRSAER